MKNVHGLIHKFAAISGLISFPKIISLVWSSCNILCIRNKLIDKQLMRAHNISSQKILCYLLIYLLFYNINGWNYYCYLLLVTY